MGERKNNIFVVGVNMHDRTSEEMAREAALKIVEITDKLMERKCIRENKIKAIADEADLIINGYAFLKIDDIIKATNLNHAEKTTILTIEVDIVLDYYKRNRKFII